MAGRKKSLAARLYAAHKKKKRQREREEAQAQKARLAETLRRQKEFEREEDKARRDVERADQARQREEIRQAQARQREDVRLDRQRRQEAAAQTRDQQQRETARKREEKQRELDLLAAESDVRTASIDAQVTALQRILQERQRNLKDRSDNIEHEFKDGSSEALVNAVEATLAIAPLPVGPGPSSAYAALYRPESRELLIECELPNLEIVPRVKAYRLARPKREILPEARKEPEVKRLYGETLARLVLRALAEAFDLSPPKLVQSIALNGYVSAKDRATGKPVRPCLISVNATREKFSDIMLDEPELDPSLCLRSHLNAIVSPHPYDLEGVRPVLTFDLSKYKFIEEMDVTAGLDGRLDLLTLKPVEFEHLIRHLFEQMGMKSWVTQGSRDDGVDGVAVNEDPIVGGLCIIQAKRYSKIVGLEAVHALAGVMDDKSAAKGVLVTTSWVGKASRDFAARNGRIEIIEGRHLKALLKEFLKLDVLIGLPKLPPAWEEKDLQ